MNKLRKRDNYLMQSLNETDRHKGRLKHLMNESADELNKASSSKELKAREVELREENEEVSDECKTAHKTTIESTVDYTDDEEDVYDENEKDEKEIRNHKRQAIYRSLQKSKRSIKNIEETMKNSRSIEKWLNDSSNLSLNEIKHQQQNKNKKNTITQVQGRLPSFDVTSFILVLRARPTRAKQASINMLAPIFDNIRTRNLNKQHT